MLALEDRSNLISMEYSAHRVAEMLDNTSWAKDFSWQQMLLMGAYFKPYTISAGRLLFDEGSYGDSMGIVISGALDIYKRERLLATLRAGRTYGEMSLIDRQPRSARALSKTDSELLLIDRASFEQLSADNPRLALVVIWKIAYFLSQNLRKTSGDLSDLLSA